MMTKNEDKYINKQDKIHPRKNKVLKNNQHPYNKITQEIDFFIAGLGTGAKKMPSAETIQKNNNGYNNLFPGTDTLMYIFFTG